MTKKPQDDNSKDWDFATASKVGGAEPVGGEIGPYKLLSVLGEGGFGIVYLAEQQKPIKRSSPSRAR